MGLTLASQALALFFSTIVLLAVAVQSERRQSSARSNFERVADITDYGYIILLVVLAC
jgi:hypothetical protein